MDKMLAGLLLILALGGAPVAYAQGSSATPTAGSQARPQSGQSAAMLADQLQTCRQHVIQLTEQSLAGRTKLASLRAERKTLGVSGGEVVRYKLANLDQEIREHSQQNQNVIAQIDSENKRCDTLAAKAAAASRGTQAQPPGGKP